MSVEALRARIVTLDSEIELQKKLLNRLEKDKSLAQRQLNAALDPVARLPLEISSEIFLQSLSTRPNEEQDVPTVLLRICHAWADVALASPRLWTTVGIHFPCGDHFAEVLPIWFQRARNFPLSVSIFLRGHSINWNHHISDILWRHGGRLRRLEIWDDDDIALIDETIDLFGDITLVSLPLLETLTIRCRHEQRIYHSSQIFDLLHGAPNIAEVIFDNMRVRVMEDPGAQVLVVSTLRRLTFGGPTTYTDDFILHYLTLPSLETLSLPLRYISCQELAVCVQRSAAPLRDLTLGCQIHNFDDRSQHLHECLCLVPSLTRFKMWNPLTDAVMELFAALADSSSLLPNLHDLIIHIYTRDNSHVSDSSWRTLVRALSTRRIEQLCIVPVTVSPPMDVLASLRELAVNGAKIHVGAEELNFVVA